MQTMQPITGFHKDPKKKKLTQALMHLIDQAEEDITSSLNREVKITYGGRDYEVTWVNAEEKSAFLGRSGFFLVSSSPNGDYPLFYGLNSKCRGGAFRNLNGNATFCRFSAAPIEELLFFANSLPEIIKIFESNEQAFIEKIENTIKSLDFYMPKPWQKPWNKFPFPPQSETK